MTMSVRDRAVLGFERLRPVFVVVALGAILAVVPGPTCLLRLTLHIPCPACGLTRAGLSLLRFDVASAMRFQPLTPLLCALVAVAVVAAFCAGEVRWKQVAKWTTGLAGAGLVVVWALRFAGLFGGPVP